MNQITIYKDNTLAGDVLIPASKSIIHRAIIAGALSKKEVIINNEIIVNLVMKLSTPKYLETNSGKI